MVVEEERPRRQQRGTAEILRCYPVPVHFHNTSHLNSFYYYTAEMSSIQKPLAFCIGTVPLHTAVHYTHTTTTHYYTHTTHYYTHTTPYYSAEMSSIQKPLAS